MQGLPINEKGFATIIDAKPSSETTAYLSEYFSDALVIGYELPPILEAACEALGTEYINIALGPLRFLPDLTVGFRSNNPDRTRRFGSYPIEDRVVAQYAGFLRARFARLAQPQVGGATALFAGQVSDDVSLIRDGMFIEMGDVEEGLVGIFRSHERVLFKRHPYASKLQAEKQLKSLRKFGSVTVSDENVYRMMSHAGITDVYALNSSVTEEARWFGARGNPLVTQRFVFGQNPGTGCQSFEQTLNCLTSLGFWSSIMGVEGRLDDTVWYPNPLRESLGMNWGLGSGMGDDDRRSRLKKVLTAFKNKL
jgi:hypothetical protein